MNTLSIFFSWFFIRVPFREIPHLAGNFLHWAWQYFSIGYFLPRLLEPWHRDITAYGRGFDLKRFLRVLVWNLISRVIGAILRAVLILAGLLVELILFVTAVSVFIFWLVLPAVVIIFLTWGLLTVF